MKQPVQIVVQPFLENSYWINDILTGIKSICDSVNYYSKVIYDEGEDFSQFGLNDSCVVIVGYDVSWLHKTAKSLKRLGCKTIIVNSWVSDDLLKNNNAVYFSMESNIEQAINYFSENKRQKTALFGINERSLADLLKKDIFIKYSTHKYGTQGKIYSFEDSLSKCFEDFLEDFSDGNIDSVICVNDTTAICLMNRLKKEGFKLPEHLHIIGMGNSELGKYVTPTLTTFEFNYFELGQQTFWLWKSMQKDDRDIHREVKLPCSFIIRESTENMIFSENASMEPQAEDCELIMDDNLNLYFEDESIKTVINFEVFFRNCDRQDISILQGIVNDSNYFSLAENLYMTDRAIRYRINKMNKKLGITTREEMVELIKSLNIFGNGDN